MIRYGKTLMLSNLGALLMVLAALLVPRDTGAPFLPAILIASALLLLGFLITFRRSVYAPLADLLKGIEALNRGDRAPRLPVRGAPEIAALSARFNEMAAQLEDARAEIDRLRMAEQQGSAIRHDINNPLSTIIGNVELLIDRCERQDEELSMRLEKILSNSLRIAEVVRRAQDLKQEAMFAQRGSAPKTDGEGTPS